jgi:toxin ParE1/3/4
MKARYTRRAFSDLEKIYSYLEARNPVAARQVIGLIDAVVTRLSEFPEAGQRSDEPDVRILFARRYPYRIYYRVASDEIAILHIRHAARRAPEDHEFEHDR